MKLVTDLTSDELRSCLLSAMQKKVPVELAKLEAVMLSFVGEAAILTLTGSCAGDYADDSFVCRYFLEVGRAGENQLNLTYEGFTVKVTYSAEQAAIQAFVGGVFGGRVDVAELSWPYKPKHNWEAYESHLWSKLISTPDFAKATAVQQERVELVKSRASRFCAGPGHKHKIHAQEAYIYHTAKLNKKTWAARHICLRCADRAIENNQL